MGAWILKLELIMRISAGLGENIAAYSGFIGQQYLGIKNTLGRELQQENIATTLL